MDIPGMETPQFRAPHHQMLKSHQIMGASRLSMLEQFWPQELFELKYILYILYYIYILYILCYIY